MAEKQQIQSQTSEKPNESDLMDPKDTKSILERLPREFFNNVLKLTLSTCDPKRQWTNDGTYGVKYDQYFGMTTSLLRLNKNIYSMAMTFLDKENDWIVFDVDFQHYLLSWIQHLVPMPVIFDRDESKFMKVLEGIIERVHVSDTLPVANCVARKGVHGLNVLVHVQPDQNPEFIKPLLSLFKMLHGTLHALSIIGFEDTDYTRALEESIAQPRSSDQVTFWGVVALKMWVLTLAPQTKGAGPCSERSGDWWQAMRCQYLIAHFLRHYWAKRDDSSWAGHDEIDSRDYDPGVMAAASSILNDMLSLIGMVWNREPDPVYTLENPNLSDPYIPRKSKCDGALITGLYLCASTDVHSNADHLQEAFNQGLNYITEAYYMAKHLNIESYKLFIDSYKMVKVVGGVVDGDVCQVELPLKGYKYQYLRTFLKNIASELRPINYRVHESFITHKLRQHEVMHFLLKESDPAAKDANFRVLDGLMSTEEGEYYLV